MDLSVIIVDYNVKYFLEQCLFSVLKAAVNIETEIFVVDNNSSDGSREYLLPKFPSVNFIWNNSNEGFAKANNRAVAMAKGNYILFLNPDTILPEDCFEKCINFFKTHQEVGALGLRMIDGSGKFLKESKRSFPSLLTSFYKLTGMAVLFPQSARFAKYYLGNLSDYKNQEVDVLAGAFMMVPQKVLSETGSFDEIFFMYGEDIDLSYRIQKAGYKNFYFAETSIIHFKGESTGMGSLNYVHLFYKAMSLFVKKHYSGSRAGIYIFLIQLAIWCRAAISATGKVLKGTIKTIKLNLFKKKKVINTIKKSEHEPQTIIISNEKDYVFISALIKNTSSLRLNVEGYNPMISIQQLPEVIKNRLIKEIIFCEDGLGFKEIISIIQQLPPGIHNKFHASGSSSIVGSNSKDHQGEYLAVNRNEITFLADHQ